MRLEVAERQPWHGAVRVIIARHNWRCRTIVLGSPICTCDAPVTGLDEFDNLIVNVGKNLYRDILQGAVTDGQIKYVATGTSNTAVAATQTQLVAESFRKVTTKWTPGTTGVQVTTVYYAPGDSNVSIQELGWFASASATATANSGIMIARVLYNHTKTNLESIQVDRTDTFS